MLSSLCEKRHSLKSQITWLLTVCPIHLSLLLMSPHSTFCVHFFLFLDETVVKQLPMYIRVWGCLISFQNFTATIHNEAFSDDRPCQCGVGIRYLRDCLSLSIIRSDNGEIFETSATNSTLIGLVTWEDFVGYFI